MKICMQDNPHRPHNLDLGSYGELCDGVIGWTPAPREANDLPTNPTSSSPAMEALILAVEGSTSPSDSVTAIMDAVRWLQVNPAHASALGLRTP